MRFLFVVTAVVMALGNVVACGSAPKKESSIVSEGSDAPPTCCCKTIPAVGEGANDILPVYASAGRMECSSQHGDCVDDVQCNAQAKPEEKSNDGVPPPPTLEPSTTPGM